MSDDLLAFFHIDPKTGKRSKLAGYFRGPFEESDVEAAMQLFEQQHNQKPQTAVTVMHQSDDGTWVILRDLLDKDNPVNTDSVGYFRFGCAEKVCINVTPAGHMAPNAKRLIGFFERLKNPRWSRNLGHSGAFCKAAFQVLKNLQLIDESVSSRDRSVAQDLRLRWEDLMTREVRNIVKESIVHDDESSMTLVLE